MTPEPESPYILARYEGESPPAPAWFVNALAQEPERGTFPSQGAEIELLTWGERGKPGLLFLPGNGAHGEWWSMIAPFFARDRRCATLSWSGMGRSERRSEDYTLQIFAGEARDAVAAACLEEGATPPIIVAHSMGGMVGLLAATGDIPFGGLILIDTPLGMDNRRLDEVRANAPRPHPAHRPFASRKDGMARFRLSPPQPCANDYIVDHIARAALVEQDGQWVWHFDPRRVTFSEDGMNPSLDQLRCPVAFLYGDRSPLLSPETLATTIATLPPATPVVPIADAAHHVLLDQPLALVAALRTLLACWPTQGGWQDIRRD